MKSPSRKPSAMAGMASLKVPPVKLPIPRSPWRIRNFQFWTMTPRSISRHPSGRSSPGWRSAAPRRSAFTEQISNEVIDVLVDSAAHFSSPLSALIFFYVHGAATRVPPTETAFAARQPQWDFDAIGTWTDGAASAQHIAWVRALWNRLEPHLQGSAYVNHLAEDDRPEKVRASFGQNYGRLRQLKAAYDPTSLLRINANIDPA